MLCSCGALSQRGLIEFNLFLSLRPSICFTLSGPSASLRSRDWQLRLPTLFDLGVERVVAAFGHPPSRKQSATRTAFVGAIHRAGQNFVRVISWSTLFGG